MPAQKRRTGPRTQKSSVALSVAPSSIESDTPSADRPASEQLPRRRSASKSSKGSLEDVFGDGDDSARRALLQRQSRRAANLREFVQGSGTSDEIKTESGVKKSDESAADKKKEKRKSARKTKHVTAKASDLVKTATDRKGNLTARDKKEKKEKRHSAKKPNKPSFETRQSDLERERLEAIKNMGQVDVNATGVVPILAIAANVLNKRSSEERTRSPRPKNTNTPRDKSPKDDKLIAQESPAVVVQDTTKSREETPRQLSPRVEVTTEPAKTESSPRNTDNVKVEPVTIAPDTNVKTDSGTRNSREPTPRDSRSIEHSPRTPRDEVQNVEASTGISPLRPPSQPVSVENSDDEAEALSAELPADEEESSEEELVRVVERQNSIVMRELDDEARALVNPSVAEIEAAMKSDVSDIQDKLDEILSSRDEATAEKNDEPNREEEEDEPSEEHCTKTPRSRAHNDNEDDSPDEVKRLDDNEDDLSSEHNEDDDESSREYDEDQEGDVLVL